MALLNRLFSSRKKQSTHKGYVPSPVRTSNLKSFDFNRDQVRVLLFRECDKRGRKLLFDSNAVKKVSLSTSKHVKFNKTEVVRRVETSFVEITNGYGYQYTRPASDVKCLGEMVFGSVAMTLRGSTFKVHTGGTPPFLMITRVTNSPGKRLSEFNLEDSCGSSISSMNEYAANPSSSSDSKLCHNAGSYPLDVPLPSSLTLGASQFFMRNDAANSSGGHHPGSLEGDSGCYISSNGSFSAAVASPDSRKGSGGSLSSLRRRWLRTASTSLDLGSSQSLTKTDSLVSSSSLQPSADEKSSHHTKLGIALVIRLTVHQEKTMQNFLLEHGMMLESITVRLQAAVERAYCRKEFFVSMMVDASCDVEQSIEDLIIGPRLSSPVWLSLTAGRVHSRTHLASNFLQEMCQIIDSFDTKDSNFFLSTLLTAVLTHHLGWVSTVMPGLQLPFSQKNAQGIVLTLSELHKVHPYNPLWAQAMDLYGALGHPLKTARTIIMSVTVNKSRHEIIEKLLRVVSYFIRCAGIENREPRLEDTNFSSCLCLCSQDSSNSFSVNDRVASSSTLRPLNGENSSLQTMYQGSTPVVATALDRSFILDNASKSENALDSALQECSGLKHLNKLSEKGLRRTMSYSCRLSSCVLNSNINANTSEIKSHKSDDFVDQKQAIVSEKEVSTAGKVIFVLGESDNLIGLRKNRKNLKNERTEGVCSTNGQEQPLSFSGSEVESGFSDCESFELSPVRSVSENILCSLKHEDQLLPGSDSKVENKIVCPTLENGVKGFEPCNSFDFSTSQVPPSDTVSPQVLTFHSAYLDVEEEECSSLSDMTSLCSLGRSVSVNLPVPPKSPKDKKNYDFVCVKCAKEVSQQGCVNASRGSYTGTLKSNTFGRLNRTQSSTNIPYQPKNPTKNIALCQSCVGKQVNSCLSRGGISEHHHSPSSVCVKNVISSSQLAESESTSVKNANVIELPLPPSTVQSNTAEGTRSWGVAGTLIGGVSSHYIPERVLQGCVPLSPGWELTLKRDLAIDAQFPTLDSGIAESVAIVANIDSWEVQLISSHTYVVDRPGTLGVRVGLSQLVANMLESVCHLWKQHTSPELCLSYLEGRLQELWARSRALSELLLSTEFCDMDLLTSSLCLEPNDVPLLLAVASTHSPEVTQRYGLSFR